MTGVRTIGPPNRPLQPAVLRRLRVHRPPFFDRAKAGGFEERWWKILRVSLSKSSVAVIDRHANASDKMIAQAYMAAMLTIGRWMAKPKMLATARLVGR